MQEIKQTEVQKDTAIAGQTKFGINQISNPTPLWVTWIFRTEFVLNKVFLFWLSSQDIIDNAHTLKVILGIVAAVDGIVWGMGKFVGVSKKDFDN